MRQSPTLRYNSGESGLRKQALVAAFLVVTALKTTDAQEDRSRLVWLFRLDGTFSAELPAKINSEDRSTSPGFALAGARVEADQRGALTTLRSVLTVANGEGARRITEVEWRLDIYDASLRSLTTRVIQTAKVNIYAGESAAASAKFGAVLPDRMVVLLQLAKVSFDDGFAWSPKGLCSLGEDLRTVSCKSK